MITVKNETILTVPTLHVVKADLRERTVPTVFFYHGYSSAKEHNLHVAYLLAEKGFRVILPDALHHGEREQTLIGKQRDLSFWDIVITSILEMEQMKNDLISRELVDGNRIGVIGTSMGAITMYGALTKYNWIKSSVSFMGTPYYERFAKRQLATLKQGGIILNDQATEKILKQIRVFDLSTQLEKLAGRPLLIWHGKEDRVVPYSDSELLYEELIQTKQNASRQLEFIAEDKAVHKVSRLAVLKSIDWFEHHLISSKVSSE